MIYKMSLLLRTGGYFLRIVLAVRVVVEQFSEIIDEPGTDDELLLCEALLLIGGGGDPIEEARAKDFVAVFNAGITRWRRFPKLQHAHTSPDCCNGHDPRITKNRMTIEIVTFILAKRPDVPSLQRWTALINSIRFFNRALGPHKLFARLLAVAFGGLESRLFDEVLKCEAERDGVDPKLIDEFFWHAASGTRLRDSKIYCNIVEHHIQMLLLSIVACSLGHIGNCLFDRNENVAEGESNPQRFLDLMNREHSPVYLALQFMSGMQRFDHPKARLVLYYYEFAGVDELYADSEKLLYVRGLFITTGAWIYAKHVRYLKSFLCGLLQILDERIDMQTRFELAKDACSE